MNKIWDSISIHQPHFLPWYPYMLRILSGESYVTFTQSKYKPQYFHNRTWLLQKDGRILSVSLPVNGSQNTIFEDVTIDSNHWVRASKKIIRVMEYNYAHSPYFQDIFEKIENILTVTWWESLEDINLQWLQVLAEILEIPMPETHKQNNEEYTGENRTDNLIHEIRKRWKSTYLTGWWGGMDPKVFDLEKFKENGIDMKYLDSSRLSKYPAQNGVSILHHLFHDGPDQVRAQMEQDQSAFVSLKI